MKNLTAILLLLAVALTITVDAGGHNRKHKSNVKKDDGDDNTDDNVGWPSPEQIHSFDVPEEFTHGGSHGESSEEHEPHSSNNNKNHGKRHHG